MAREISAGGVVVRPMRGRWWLAAIEPRHERFDGRGRPRPGLLALPKGLVDPGERSDQAALREIHEETGLRADLVAKLTDIRYVYLRSWGDQERVFKVVTFYLCRYRSGRLGEISPAMRHEVSSTAWVPLEEAPRRLAYKGEREVASLALLYLQAHPELKA